MPLTMVMLHRGYPWFMETEFYAAPRRHAYSKALIMIIIFIFMMDDGGGDSVNNDSFSFMKDRALVEAGIIWVSAHGCVFSGFRIRRIASTLVQHMQLHAVRGVF